MGESLKLLQEEEGIDNMELGRKVVNTRVLA